MQYLKVKAHPEARKRDIIQRAEDSFEVWVKEKKEEGRANDAMRLALAKYLGIAPERLRLIKGRTSPSKIFVIAETIKNRS